MSVQEHDEFFYNGVRYYTQEQLDSEINRARDEEARAAANRVESLPFRDHGRTVNRNDAILAARRGLKR